MALLISNYDCEWRKVVETPALREEFNQFANSTDIEDDIEFVKLRDQKKVSFLNYFLSLVFK